jgi:hypothetical protein
VEIVELLVRAGAADKALRLHERAAATDTRIYEYRREGLLRARQTVATGPVKTSHFDIYPAPEVPDTVIRWAGPLLEAELSRILPAIGLSAFKRVRVNLLTYPESADSSAEDTLGFYDGAITIPCGDVQNFRGTVARILTHELAHAVVDQATDGRSPAWFQEAVARRMELVERHENVFERRMSTTFPAIGVLDALIENGSEDHLSVAYAFLRFLEEQDAGAIPKLAGAFRKAETSDAALLEVTGRSLSQLDTAFREWGATRAGAFVDDTPWRYTQFYGNDMDVKALPRGR